MKNFDIDKIQLNIQSPQSDIDQVLTNYIFSKINKLGKTFARIEKCNVVLKEVKSHDNKNFEVAAEIFVPGQVFYACEKMENPRQSIKMTFEDLQKQLVHFKEKLEEKNPN